MPLVMGAVHSTTHEQHSYRAVNLVQQEIAAVIQKQKELEEGFLEVSNRNKMCAVAFGRAH